ncbi:MAG TPA: hypothetical protein VLY20_12520 [Nitrospiria bacterium]|nr:hypothetical protein [Nitrospiria bacterium]
MVKFMAVRTLKIKTPAGPKVFRPGDVFIPKDETKAMEFVRLGLIQPLKHPMPFLRANNDLVIPFDADLRFHWWAGGQSIAETLRELNALPEVMRRYGTC